MGLNRFLCGLLNDEPGAAEAAEASGAFAARGGEGSKRTGFCLSHIPLL